MSLEIVENKSTSEAPHLVLDVLSDFEKEILNSTSQTLSFNMIKPQRSFRYPDFLPLPYLEGQSPLEYVRELLKQSGHRPLLYRNKKEVLKYLLDKYQIKNCAHLGPQNFELASLECSWRRVTRDPQELLESDLSGFDALYFSNPHLVDGVLVPQDLAASLYQKLRIKNPHLIILSDESAALSVFNGLEVPTLKDFVLEDPLLFVIDSIYPVRSPSGPFVSWLYNKNENQQLPLIMDAKEMDWSFRAIQCFEKKSGASFFEFERRMISTAHSLKRLASQLNHDLIEKRILVPHWPDAGFYLNLNLRPLLKEKSFQSSTAFVHWAAKEHSLLLLPGSYYGDAHSIAISYAASNPYMDQFASALAKALK